jgi:hypothetical protein
MALRSMAGHFRANTGHFLATPQNSRQFQQSPPHANLPNFFKIPLDNPKQVCYTILEEDKQSRKFKKDCLQSSTFQTCHISRL